MDMKKLFMSLFAFLLVLTLVGCGCQKKDNKIGEDGEVIVYHSAAELKELAKKAGYITHDETLCYTGYEDRSEGFSVELQKEDKSLVPYCILVMNNEELAKELCNIMQNEYTSCVRYGQAITFPESNSSADFVKILTSIIQGKPVNAPQYIFE